MNSSDICHQVEGCPGLFVDAFRGHFLREHTKNPEATFILSHYHGDHYTQLPRDYKYRGPAKIHCTPTTARLLVDVHLVSKDLVVEHDYGVTFRHRIFSKIKDGHSNDTDEDDKNNYVEITFYDANHCPGACIILIALPDGNAVHLHTGDMRYHPRFQKYPLLAQATHERKLDLVYLDTTYCHPKHNFLTQDDAVDTIASQTQELLSDDNPSKTLVLLSCYSIGKEKVLYEASKRTGQSIYVSEKKWKMLNCMQHKQSEEKEQTLEHQQHMNILEKCTRDPLESDLHVIPMGLAGEMWPYFQPNYQKLAKYVQDLSTMENTNNEGTNTETSSMSAKDYDRVVAFIPTGWADATNWNKKNAVSTKVVQLSESKSLHVEVRLISYSEHSTFPELVNFVQYLKPRKVIPTVYGDANHKRQIEGRFRNMLDSNRAKQAFFRSMTKKKTSSGGASKPIENKTEISSHAKETMLTKSFQNDDTLIKKENSGESKLSINSKENNLDNDEIEVVDVIPCKKFPRSSSINNDKVDMIVSMGFDRKRAEATLEKCHGHMERAIHELLSESTCSTNSATNAKRATAKDSPKAIQSSRTTTSAVKKRKISDFFGQRKK